MPKPLLAAVLLFAFVGPAAAQSVPRPEYPQPQFARADWRSLNGRWTFEFDDANAGINARWAAGTHRFSKTITVPFAFETPKSGIGDRGFHPWVWYRRSVTIPAAWRGRHVLLRFGAVDYRARVWVNGSLAGTHEGGNTPFTFDITPLLHAGPNTLVVRAEDSPTDRHQPRGKQYWEPQSKSIFYSRTSGIWQSVWIEAAGASHLDEVRITPSIDGAVAFEAHLAASTRALTFRATVTRDGATVATGESAVTDGRSTLTLNVANPQLWSPDHPNLYDVTFELVDNGRAIDRVQSYFGYRRITIGRGRLLINGEPTYLKMVLDQGYWPESNLTPPSDEAIASDIRIAKSMGFNGARKHQKVADPRYLYWADRLGFLVSGEMANAQQFDADYVAEFTREWLDIVARDYNHPSIVMWVPINESWGVPAATTSAAEQAHLQANYWLIKSLDPTRLVIDNDGWQHTGTTDLFGFHDYARTGDDFYKKYKDAGSPGFVMPANGRPVLLPGFADNGSPRFLSEFGGIAYIAPGSHVPADAWGYAGVEPDAASALARMRGLYEAIARVPAIMGVCYTQLTDVEQEINGLLTYDRTPKYDVAAIRALNDLLH